MIMAEIKTKMCTDGVIDTSLEEREMSETQGYNPLEKENQNPRFL